MHYALIALLFLLHSVAWSKANREAVQETNLEFQKNVDVLNKKYEDFFVRSQEVKRQRLKVEDAAQSHKAFR